jgi:hypothetical protein
MLEIIIGVVAFVVGSGGTYMLFKTINKKAILEA